ncbi:MAG: hypothetical protein QOD75_1695 [Blastocatellia bacterium]|jgi:hypothetical protein|nr:hypothetical protein [Blastocatellia bacterium]
MTTPTDNNGSGSTIGSRNEENGRVREPTRENFNRIQRAYAKVAEIIRRLQRNEHRRFDIDGDQLKELLAELAKTENEATDTGKKFIRPEYPENPQDRTDYPDPSDGNNRNYRKPPYAYIDEEWHLGWTDGRVGQPPRLNKDIVEARVRTEAAEALLSTQAKMASKETTIAGLSDLLDKRKVRLESKEDFYNKLSDKRNRNYLEFSRSLGYLYLFFAILLFLADIPLSLKLVASGFQVPVEADLPAGVAPIGSSTKLLIDHLLFHPWVVLGNFWESLALAAGIAFVGIIVKYYVDLIVLRDAETPGPKKLAIVVLTVILFGFVTTIFFLGNFRAEQQSQAVRRQVETNLRNENEANKIFNSGNPNALRKIFRENEITEEVTKRFNDTQALSGSKWLIQTFIALTLLLPIVGGVCFSASGSKLRNAKQYWFALLDYKKLEIECDKLSLSLKKEEGDLQGLRENLKQILGDPDRLKSRAELKLGLYLHGYARGQTVPETLEEGASLYERCEKTVTKLLAKKSRERFES